MIPAHVEVGKNIKNVVAKTNNSRGDKMLGDWKKDIENLKMRLADLRVSL